MSMALMFPWATKEYLLWEMSIGQIVMYHNLGADIKAGVPADSGNPRSLRNMSVEEVRKIRDDLRKQGYTKGLEQDRQKSEAAKAPFQDKYGDI